MNRHPALLRIATACGLAFALPFAQAAGPLTVQACQAMKTEPMRQQCLLSAVDAPPSITGKTYSTQDVRPRGPVAYEVPAPTMPIAPVVPYVNVTPGGGRPGNPPR